MSLFVHSPGERGKESAPSTAPRDDRKGSLAVRGKKGNHKGESFPPYTEEDAFSSSVSFCFLCFLLSGVIGSFPLLPVVDTLGLFSQRCFPDFFSSILIFLSYAVGCLFLSFLLLQFRL